MEAIAEPFFQVPQGVNHAVDRTKNIISRCWNIKRQSADTAKLRKQAFSVEKPRIGQLIERQSLRGAHGERRWSQRGRRWNINLAILINVIHEGIDYDFI
jgi:hypothetical protein